MPYRNSMRSSQDPEPPSTIENALLSHPLELEDQLSLADPPEVTLRKAFSVDSAASRPARRRQEEVPAGKTLPPFRAVGQGSFGVVYAQTGTPYVFKAELHQRPADHLLWKELISHKAVCEAFEKAKMLGISVHVPQVIDYVTADDEGWWEEHMEGFGDDNKSLPERRHLIQAERIFPVPERVRESLIQMYCPEAAKKAARASKANRDCLVRIYLGKDTEERRSRFFTLRNFRLHKNQMEQLGLDLTPFAEAIGQALAVIHWIAITDARDVEFVLGSSPTGVHDRVRVPCLKELQHMLPNSQLHPQAKGFNFRQRMVHVWCLDFNQVRPITLDSAGVEMCVDAFFANDPYYPRPGATELWAAFSDSYLKTAEKALLNTENMPSISADDMEKIRSQNLARCFLTAVEKQWLQKQGSTN